MKRIAILTGGGDAPGLNPVIRGATYALLAQGYEVIGFYEGWRGVLTGEHVKLEKENTKNLVYKGGTILGSSRTNPYKDAEKNIPLIHATMKKLDLEGIIACGGEDTLGVAMKLWRQEKINIIGCPKTIDNDIAGTDVTFGFDSAVNVCSDVVDKVRTTAKSHRRVLVVEVMGRHAGWIAAHVGIASGADYTLLPEKPVDIDELCAALLRSRKYHDYNIIVASEGASLKQGDVLTQDGEVDDFGHVKLGGISKVLEKLIMEKTGLETRHMVVGYLQRAGRPSARDRVLATRYGIRAGEQAVAGNWGVMLALLGNQILPVELTEAITKIRTVDEQLIEDLEMFFD